METITSPEQTKGWVSDRSLGYEVFTTPSGEQYTRCTEAEQPDCIVTFTKMLGLEEVRLRLVANSKIAKRHGRKLRRQKREQNKREKGND